MRKGTVWDKPSICSTGPRKHKDENDSKDLLNKYFSNTAPTGKIQPNLLPDDYYTHEYSCITKQNTIVHGDDKLMD